MRRRHYFLRRFAMIISIGILVSLLLLFFISTRLVIQTLDSIGRSALNEYLDQGENLLLSYLDGKISLADLEEKINPELSLSLTYLILLDDEGRTIAASHSATSYTSLATVESEARKLADVQQVFRNEENPQSFNGLVVGRPVMRAGSRMGSVFAGIVNTESVNARHQFNFNIFIAIWPLFAVLALISLAAARHFVNPIQVLADTTRQIAAGKWGTTIDVPLPGEMGSLAKDFNEMSTSLARTITSLDYEKNNIKLMLEGLREGIVAMDDTGGVLHQNGAALDLLAGPESPEYQLVIAEIKRCIQGDEPVSGKITVRGVPVEYAIRKIPPAASGGQATSGAVALLRDITASERLEQTRHDYVANISHELRTPLTAMRGLIEPLRDGLVNDAADRQRCYDMIAAETLRLSRLVNDLLELSGIQSSTAAFETEKTDTADLLQDSYYRNRHLFKAAGLTFELDVPPELPFVQTNEDRMIQVLTVFLDNARKYTPAGGFVRLGARVVAGGVQISVTDSGIGMDEATQRQVFDRFFQGDQSRHDRGNGLGLSIAKEILNKLAIDLTVTSTPGQGSTFTLTLPLARPDNPDAG